MFEKCRKVRKEHLHLATVAARWLPPVEDYDYEIEGPRYQINVPDKWCAENRSYADDLMTLSAKKPGWDWGGNLQFYDRLSYSRYSLNDVVRVSPT